MKFIIEEPPETVAESAAVYVRKKVKEFEPSTDRYFVLGLTSGSIPIQFYQKLIEFYKSGTLSFKFVKIFLVDEFAGLPSDHEKSNQTFLNENLIRHLDIESENVHFLNGMAEDLRKELDDYEAKILAAGGMELLVGGDGSTGQLVFNEYRSSSSHVRTLQEGTARVAFRFPNPLNRAITVAQSVEVKSDEKELLHLPNELISRIVGHLDFRSTRKIMRVSKRMADVVRKSRQGVIKKIAIKFNHGFFRIDSKLLKSGVYAKHKSLAEFLTRISKNTYIENMKMELGYWEPTKHGCDLISALCKCRMHYLRIDSDSPPTLEYSTDPTYYDVVRLRHLMGMADNCENVVIGQKMSHVSMDDLCKLRKKMMSRSSKRGSFTVREVPREEFLEECFGVTMEVVKSEGRTPLRVIYRAANPAVQMHVNMNWCCLFEEEFESDQRILCTTVDFDLPNVYNLRFIWKKKSTLRKERCKRVKFGVEMEYKCQNEEESEVMTDVDEDDYSDRSNDYDIDFDRNDIVDDDIESDFEKEYIGECDYFD